MTAEHPIDELKAIAHPLRLSILQALRKGERNVGEIEQVTQIGQPALSQQLGVLRKAGLVETRKHAKLVYYKLATDRLAVAADAIAELVEANETLEKNGRTSSPGAAHFARLS